MSVRKKNPDEVKKSMGTGDTMNLTRHLQRVREAIKTLPTDEQERNMNEATTSVNESKNQTTPHKRTAGAKKKSVKKTVAKKTNGDGAGKNTVTLAEIAKSIKMEPRRARRILRGCDLKAIEVEGQRWTWTKGSAAATKVKEVLQAADKAQ